MKAFQYASARSVASARELVAENGAYLSGGVDLLGQMKDYLVEPKILVNVKTIPGLNKIESGRKAWSIGGNVTITALEDHEGIRKTFLGIQQAAAEVGSRQIRNVSTVGGNPAHHHRRFYFPHPHVPSPQHAR